ncbi:hypothetical protein AB0D49_40115 [Streptomyces sp. NPDC048290]|uniref:hypothetical protein n=1 Tax=Streptomyces sp. NPDC048290 TaxID=3155811 RepID=UPI003449292B
MGSLRNPIGPLPSSIYWRRRAVLVSVVALLALLTAWIVLSGGGGGDNGAEGSNSKNPAPSITPGPSRSGPAISQAPGGRDESDDGGGDGGSGGTGGGDSAGSGDGSEGSSGSTGGTDGSAGSGGSGGSGTAAGGTGVGAGDALPAGSPLATCAPGSVTLTVRSVRNSYSPDQKAQFQLIARNSSTSDCKVDLGPKGAVVTITQAGEDSEFWSSADCPRGAANLLYRVPAESSITYTLDWDRQRSAPECATPDPGRAGAGTYLVEARATGFTKVQTSFVLTAD